MHPRSALARACTLGVAGVVLLSGATVSASAAAQAAPSSAAAQAAPSSTVAEAAPSSADGTASSETPITITSGTTYVAGDPLTVTGTGLADSTIRVWIDDVLVAHPQLTTDPDGRWSLDIGVSVTASRDSFRLRLYGEDGHDSTTTFTADPDAQPTPVTITSGTTYVQGDPFTITGTGLPGTEIRSWVDGTPIVSPRLTVDADGRWAFAVTPTFARQDSFTLRLLGVNGHDTTTTFTADPDGTPTPVTITSGTTYTKGAPLTIEGTGLAGTDIHTWFDGTYMADPKLTVAEDGSWSLRVSPTFVRQDSFTLRLVGVNDQQVESTFTAAEPAPANEITVATTTFTRGQKQLIEGTAAPGARVNVHSGSKYLMHVTADTAGAWSYTTGAAITSDTFTRTLKSEGTEDVTFTLTAR